MTHIDSALFQSARCEDCGVRNRSLCSMAASTALERFGQISHTQSVHVNDGIIREAEEALIVGIVLKGIVRITKALPDGRVPIMGFIYPGEPFGQPYAEIAQFSYEAATDVELCVMDRRAFELVVSEYPDFEHAFMLSTLDRLGSAQEHLVLLGCQSALERISTYLLLMLDRREALLAGVIVADHKHIAVSAVPRADLAAYLNTTIETISRQIHLLSARGVIKLVDHNQFEILNVSALAALSGVGKESRHRLRSIRSPRVTLKRLSRPAVRLDALGEPI